MSQMMLMVLVTGAWFLITGILGFFLSRKGRPYHLVLTILHGILSLFILAGAFFILQGVTNSKLLSFIFLCLLGIASFVNFISGLMLAIIRKDTPKLVLTHKIGSLLIIISIVASIIFLALNI